MDIRYDEETLENINNSVNLFEYVEQTGKYEFRHRGKHYYTNCPKHVDKTPSLCFTPEENICKCFSCGRGGKIINYLKDYEDLSFKDAVEKAAKLAEIDLSTMCQSRTLMFLRSFKKPKRVLGYVHPILDRKRDYEKFKQEPVKEWQNEGIKQEVMDLFGVRIDYYSNRIIYPVFTIKGDLINIKGRTRYPNFKELGIEKYMNYYEVGELDYFQGLNITLPYVKQQDEIIIFESIKSVMKAYGWGYRNCASMETHTMTDWQVDLLIKLRCDIVFALDSDVNYKEKKLRRNIERLKRLTNVYIIYDSDGLLGGQESKNAPVDLGQEVWEQLYSEKKKVI